MSGKNTVSKLGATEIVTGFNTVGLCYVYYELNRLGIDVNERIKKVAGIVKTLNTNVNIIYEHFSAHLIKHKTVLDIQNIEEDDNINKPLFDKSNELRFKELEDRIAYLESKIGGFEEKPFISNCENNNSNN